MVTSKTFDPGLASGVAELGDRVLAEVPRREPVLVEVHIRIAAAEHLQALVQRDGVRRLQKREGARAHDWARNDSAICAAV